MKEKIGILHEFYESMGGGEFLSIALANALYDGGYNVKILTFSDVNKDRLREIFGLNPNVPIVKIGDPPKVTSFLSALSGGRFVRLRRLMTYWKFFEEYLPTLKDEYDLIIETQSNLPSASDISYIHYPAILDYLEEIGNKSLLRRLYNFYVERYIKRFTNVRPSALVLTNSTWTKKKIKKAYDMDAEVLYPPVNVEEFYCTNNDRENLIVTVSRFTPEKNLDAIVDLASLLQNYEFVVVGTTDKYSSQVINKILEKKKNYGIGNVTLKPNLPRAELRKLLCRARFYVHPPFPEHFGIAVVEAMASGAIPFVYKDGGAWEDIVSKMKMYTLSYERVEEIWMNIRFLEKKKGILDMLRGRSQERAMEFSFKRFQYEALRYVERVLESG